MDPYSEGEDTARVLMGPDVGTRDPNKIDERRRVEWRGRNVGEGRRAGEFDWLSVPLSENLGRT